MKFRISSIRTGLLGLFSAAVLFTMSACNKDRDNNNDPDIPVAGLMAFNLAPDVSSAGIALSGNNLGNGLSYGSYTGGYLPIYTGSRQVESYNSASGARLANDTYEFRDSAYYSLFVVGAGNNYRNVIVEDDITGLTGDGRAYVRYINAIPDSAAPTVALGSLVSETAAFASVSGFRAVPAGDLAITVNNGSSISAERTIGFEANKIYTLLLTGQPEAGASGTVEIKYIVNGTLDASGSDPAGKGSARSAN